MNFGHKLCVKNFRRIDIVSEASDQLIYWSESFIAVLSQKPVPKTDCSGLA